MEIQHFYNRQLHVKILCLLFSGLILFLDSGNLYVTKQEKNDNAQVKMCANIDSPISLIVV